MRMQFTNVTAEAKANVYFDGKVVSHGVTLEDGTTKEIIGNISSKTKIFCPFCDHTTRTHPNKHNAFIDMLVNGGIIGLSLFIAFIVSWYKLIRKSSRERIQLASYKYAVSIFSGFIILFVLQGGTLIYESIFIIFSN